MKSNDPQKIVTNFLTEYVRRQLARGTHNKTAESLGHLLTGIRISRMYRKEIPEEGRELVARQFLRGIFTDSIY